MLRRTLRHISGQTFASVLQFCIGILFIRFLSVNEYGLYVIAASIQAIVCCTSDFGLASGVNTLVSRSNRRGREILGILSAAWLIRKRFNVVALFIGFVASYLMLVPATTNISHVIILLVISVFSGLFQGQTNILKSVLNADQDDRGLLYLALAEIFPRLVLLPLVIFLPLAWIAILLNLMSAVAVNYLVKRVVSIRTKSVENNFNEVPERELADFVYPLIPSVTYTTLQGHLGIFLLGLAGYTHMVAETGALGRLAQMLGLLSVLNPFWIQPYFARISQCQLRPRIILLLTVLLSALACFVLSAIVFPEAWAWVLGEKYANTTDLVVLSVASASFYLCSSFVYTVLLSQGITKGQTLSIGISLSLQLMMIFVFGINSTRHALLLSMIPGLVSFLVQIGLVWFLILNSKRRSPRS
jgi:O-antigen/teichoic acid export membrane protein